MDESELKKLISILQNANISELEVSVDGAKVRLRKPLSAATVLPEVRSQKPEVKSQKPEARSKKPAVYITAPMVGIFHSVDAVAAIGTDVKSGQVVGAIESMKLMNDVVSEHDGIIVETLVEDGMAVEYGHNLFRLEQA